MNESLGIHLHHWRLLSPERHLVSVARSVGIRVVLAVGAEHHGRLLPVGVEMSQRNSEYARMAGDTYVTPKWVYEALYSVESLEPYDCAPISPSEDFLSVSRDWARDLVTNPPFKLAEKFVRHALMGTKVCSRSVAMLLPHAWDTANSRRDLFEQMPFKAKYTLTKRIRWENLEQKKNGPSMNHAWFVWDWNYEGKPFLGYLP